MVYKLSRSLLVFLISLSFFILNICSISLFVFADGCVMMQPVNQDMLTVSAENNQYAFINYKNNREDLMLSININTSEINTNNTKNAFWIFPIPSNPGNVDIRLVKEFPVLFGYDVVKKGKESFDDMSNSMLATQLYTLPFFYFTASGNHITEGFEGQNDKENDLLLNQNTNEKIIYKSINMYGLETQLISTKNKDALERYFNDKNLSLSNELLNIINDYVYKNYSFVVSSISNIEDLKTSLGKNNMISVFVSFDVTKPFFPLKLTSVYDNKVVPAFVYVLDDVKPMLFDEIKNSVKINYFEDKHFIVDNNLTSLFRGHDLLKENKNLQYIQSLKYTKVEVNAPSNAFVDDLWFDVKTPSKVHLASFFTKNKNISTLVLFLLFSSISSFLAGYLFFKNSDIWTKIKPKLFALGFFNILSLGFFMIGTYFLKTKKIEAELENEINGSNAFTNSFDKYLGAFYVFLFLFFIFFLFSSFNFNFEWEKYYFISVLFFCIYLVFKLSIKDMINVNFPNYKIVDLKVFFFLVFSNILFLGTLILLAIYKSINLQYTLDKLFFFNLSEDRYLIFILLFVFEFSVFLLMVLNNVFTKYFPKTGIVVLPKDSKKIGFVIVFSLSFIYFVFLFKFLMEFLIS